jgi:hypothetical protein
VIFSSLALPPVVSMSMIAYTLQPYKIASH